MKSIPILAASLLLALFILRVSNLSSDGWNKVKIFLEAQLGKPYSIVVGRRNSSISLNHGIVQNWHGRHLNMRGMK